MKNLIKTLIFIVLFCIIFSFINKMLWAEQTTITYFYEEPKNSIDVVYIGPSNAYIHFNSTLAYKKYGFTTQFLSTNSEPFIMTKYLIKESEKYQKPSLYVIDLTRVGYTMNEYTGEEIRRTVDSMRPSINRIKAINESLSLKKEISPKDYINYYFSFFMYHNSWKNVKRYNLTGLKNYFKGYRFDEITAGIEPQKDYIWTEKEEIEQECYNILVELINVIKQNNLNVIFIVPIRNFDEKSQKSINYAIRIINNNNLKVINFNTLSDFKNIINFESDFYDKNHINVYGAMKYTLYFGKYLKDEYNLDNHLKDEKYETWNIEYNRLKTSFKQITGKEFEEQLINY